MLRWKDDFSVGIPLIDEQHKRLFEIGNTIAALLKTYDGQDAFIEIMDQIDALVEYTKYHFEQEEKLMGHYHYSDIEAHIKEHRDFIVYLDSLNYHTMNNEQEKTLIELIKFVTTWVFKHIMNTDFKYSDYIVEAMKSK